MIVLTSWRAATILASSGRPMIFGTIRAARIARITTTTITSMSVKPLRRGPEPGRSASELRGKMR